MIRVVHVITDLHAGGAQGVMLRLVAAMDRSAFSNEVVVLGDPEPLAPRLRETGVPVHLLGMRPGVPSPRAIVRLARRLRACRADVVQTWLYHADLVGGLAAAAVRVPVVWGVRRSHPDAATMRRSTMWTARVCALLSRRLPARIVACAYAARDGHVRAGYAEESFEVIPNGFDVERFSPDQGARDGVRDELGFSTDARLVGLVARWHPQKDHATFAAAASRIAAEIPEAAFVLCGQGIAASNARLVELISAAGIADRTRLLGVREDVPRITAALDVAVSSSLGEGFPNALGEAMACGIPCVATDVGDTAELMGSAGRLIDPGDPAALAAAAIDLLRNPAAAAELGVAARQRVRERYSLEEMTSAYQRVYGEVARVRDRRSA